jgi:hypothetical protein
MSSDFKIRKSFKFDKLADFKYKPTWKLENLPRLKQDVWKFGAFPTHHILIRLFYISLNGNSWQGMRLRQQIPSFQDSTE